MNKTIAIATLLLLSLFAQAQKAGNIDLAHWKLELPSGYTASEWKLSNFQKDRFAKPFFYLDSLDGALVMEAYPVVGKSKAKYTKNTLREQMVPGSSDTNWTLTQGAILEAEFQVAEMSIKEGKNYDRTLLFQIHGRTTEEQTGQLGLSKSVSLPMFKVFWEDERIRVQRKVLVSLSDKGQKLWEKDSWDDDDGRFFNKKVGFEKVKIKIKAEEGKITVVVNDLKPIVYKDTSIKKWEFENYFEVGNYLQTKQYTARSVVKFYDLKVTH